MASKTIHTLNYKLLVDSTDFEKGMIASRKELGTARRELTKMLTPAEKMQVALEKLGNIAKKDAKFQELYNKKLAEYQKHLKKIAADEKRLAKQRERERMDRTKAFAAAGLRGASIAGAAGIAAGVVGANQFTDQVTQIDAVQKRARAAGLTIRELTAEQFRFMHVGGQTAEQVTMAYEQMNRRIGQAALGLGEAKTVIERLGMDPQTLARMRPIERMNAISRALDQYEDSSERAAIAGAFVGEEQSRMHEAMRMSREEMEKMHKAADGAGFAISEQLGKQSEDAVDAITDLTAAMEALKRTLTGAVAPEATRFIRMMTLGVNMRRMQFDPDRLAVQFGRGMDTVTGQNRVSGYNWRPNREGGLFNFERRERTVGPSEQQALESRREKILKEQLRQANRAIAARNPATNVRAPDMFSRLFDRSNQGNVYARLATSGYGATVEPRGSGGPNFQSNMFARLANAMQSYGVTAAANPSSPKSFDPVQSIAAGSSEAFNILHRTQSRESVEVQVANKQLGELEQQTVLLKEWVQVGGPRAKPKDDGAGI